MYNVNNGYDYFQNASAVRVNRAAEAIALFRHALEHRVNTTTDLGKAQQFSALIIQVPWV